VAGRQSDARGEFARAGEMSREKTTSRDDVAPVISDHGRPMHLSSEVLRTGAQVATKAVPTPPRGTLPRA
jgi:hypothetical protein